MLNAILIKLGEKENNNYFSELNLDGSIYKNFNNLFSHKRIIKNCFKYVSVFPVQVFSRKFLTKLSHQKRWADLTQIASPKNL